MEPSGPRSPDPEVPLADAARAAEIGRIAARGRGADRAPTLEQLLAAFDEHAPTDAARRRVAAALRVAGIGVRPDLLQAQPGQRLMLLPPGVSRSPSRVRAAWGVVALSGVLLAAVLAATLIGGSDDQRASDLPATSSAAAPAATTAPPATTPTVAEDGPQTTPTQTTPTQTTPTQTDTTAEQEQGTRTTATTPKRSSSSGSRSGTASKVVVVRLDAGANPTFLCVDDGNGKELFNGTLDGSRTFKGEHIRLNVGLASTSVRVDGTPVRLDGSPAGLDVTRSGGARALPLGQRPCA